MTARAAAAPLSPAPGLGWVWAVALVAVATLVGWVARPAVDLPDVVMLYLLAIMVAAARFGRVTSLVAAALSVGAFDFFFIPPFFSFAVTDFRHVFTFVMMFVVGLVISGLTQQLKASELEAQVREARTAVLYALSRDLAAALDDSAAAQVLATHAAALLGDGAGVALARQAKGALAGRAGALDFGEAEQEEVVAVLQSGATAGIGAATRGTARTTCVPLRSGQRTLGVLALSPRRPPADTDARDLLEAVVHQGALALERAQLAEDARAAALKARTEQMRATLLSAVSHDLRTPLASITGAATTLKDAGGRLTAAQRDDLVAAICEEAVRLERQVGNLLDMTRLESGAVRLKREWVPLLDVVGSALTRLDEKLGARKVQVDVPPDLVSVDPVLLEQLFVNLLDNAAKFTPAGSPLEVKASLGKDTVEVEVLDRGPGLAPGEAERVFEKFYRSTSEGSWGVGLGLSICRAIVQVHGGTISAANREGGGAVFRFSLPRVGEAPAPPPEAP